MQYSTIQHGRVQAVVIGVSGATQAHALLTWMCEPRQACPPDVLNEAPHSVQLLLCSLSNGDLGPNGLIVLPNLAADSIMLSLNGLTVKGMRLL